MFIEIKAGFMEWHWDLILLRNSIPDKPITMLNIQESCIENQGHIWH